MSISIDFIAVEFDLELTYTGLQVDLFAAKRKSNSLRAYS